MSETVVCDEREWRRYVVEWDGPDGTFGATIFAVSMEHAAAVVEDMKATLRLRGKLERVEAVTS